MIVDKRMKFIKSENDINYYLFKPSILSLYYNEKIKHKEYPVHLHTLSHKLHMLLYIVTNIRWGGYRVLYLENKGEILSYIAFTKANNRIIKNCEKWEKWLLYNFSLDISGIPWKRFSNKNVRVDAKWLNVKLQKFLQNNKQR